VAGAFPQENFLKKVKKPLDKQHRVCYNKDTKEVKESNGEEPKPTRAM
jgi:hypothetical protein